MKFKSVLIALALTLTGITPSEAQTGGCPTSTALTIVDDGNVCVTVASDYNATHDPDGSGPQAAVPLVTRLDLLLFAPGVDSATGTPTQTISLGKPTVNAQGAVWVVVPAVTQIPVGQQYRARVVSVGIPLTAGGPAQVSPRSPESNPFIRVAPAPAPLAPTGVSVPG